MESIAGNLITLSITPSNGTTIQNVNIGLINCPEICNKSDQISDVIKDMDFYAFIITKTCLADW